MKGTVLDYNKADSKGLIRGEDGEWYSFSNDDLSGNEVLDNGTEVEFLPEGNQTGEITVLDKQADETVLESPFAEVAQYNWLMLLKSSITFLLQFIFILPLRLWKDSCAWLGNRASDSFFDTVSERDYRVIASFEAISHVLIFLSYVVGAVMGLLMFFVVARSGYGFSVMAGISSMLFTWAVAYFYPLGIAMLRELWTLLLQVARYTRR